MPKNTAWPLDPNAPTDLGLGAVVGDPAENGKFKVMTVRNPSGCAAHGKLPLEASAGSQGEVWSADYQVVRKLDLISERVPSDCSQVATAMPSALSAT